MVIIDERDIGKTREQILLDLLYEALGERLEETWYTHGTPEALEVTPRNPTDPNTFMRIQYAPHYKEVSSEVGVMYRRRHIAEHLAQYSFDLSFSRFPTTTRQIVEDLINPHLNFPLASGDFLDEVVNDPLTTAVRIKAHPDSVIWCGETSQSINLPGEEFFVLAQVTILGGFQPYDQGA
jgi:hypothetical protein